MAIVPPRHAREVAPTPLQLAVLRQKAAGRTDASAARALNVGERTVRRQLDELASALGVAGRAELFIEVGRQGWLDHQTDASLAMNRLQAL